MSRPFALCRSQRNASCRLNSAFVGVYLIEHPEIIKTIPYEPKLIAYLKALDEAETRLTIANIDLDPPLAALTSLLQTMSTKHWLNEKQIKELNELIKENPALKNALEITNDSEDPLGLQTTYDAVRNEVNEVPILNRVGTVIRACESYYDILRKQDSKNEAGLEHKHASQAVKSEELQTKLDIERLPTFGRPKVVYRDEAPQMIDDLFNDAADEQLIQMTTMGHTTVFGKKNGQYWQFDSLDSITEDHLICATLTLYDNKAEALAAMKARGSRAPSEFVEVGSELSPLAKAKKGKLADYTMADGCAQSVARLLSTRFNIEKFSETLEACTSIATLLFSDAALPKLTREKMINEVVMPLCNKVIEQIDKSPTNNLDDLELCQQHVELLDKCAALINEVKGVIPDALKKVREAVNAKKENIEKLITSEVQRRFQND